MVSRIDRAVGATENCHRGSTPFEMNILQPTSSLQAKHLLFVTYPTS